RPNHSCKKEPFQQLLDQVFEYIDEPTRQFHRMRIDLFMSVMRQLSAKYNFNEFKRGLDIGCNAGIYSRLIADFGIQQVTGIDIEPILIQKASNTFGRSADGRKISFLCMPAEQIDISQHYDFILCTEVIEHTNEPEKVIQIIKDTLKPGGIAIITLPNAFSLPFALSWLKYKIQFKPLSNDLRDHLNYPFYKSLKLFKDERIKLIETTGTNLYYWMFMHRLPFFHLLNCVNFALSGKKPFCYVSQFFFMILTKTKS
ncbi:MAG: class I SAM-dependent methyltransferase, partial [Chitinophagales bacterium]|nr:class I SAM-dependent methyltransferase [Chitinophagales bacterium]